MPTKIRTLNQGDFVRSPEASRDESWIEYVKMIDRLLEERRQAQARWDEAPFAAELGARKRQLDGYLGDYTAMFKDKYTVMGVEHDPAFLHVSKFFLEYYPVQEPFSVLHCNLDLPLHTVRRFETHEDLKQVNLALDEDTPLRWWHNGPLGRPCYLFGQCFWELKPSEVAASEEGLALLFSETIEKERQKQDRLTGGGSTMAAVATVDAVPAKVRLAVWRRDRGKCAKCGGREQVDFEYRIPPSQGGTESAENAQLLCENCRRD